MHFKKCRLDFSNLSVLIMFLFIYPIELLFSGFPLIYRNFPFCSSLIITWHSSLSFLSNPCHRKLNFWNIEPCYCRLRIWVMKGHPWIFFAISVSIFSFVIHLNFPKWQPSVFIPIWFTSSFLSYFFNLKIVCTSQK